MRVRLEHGGQPDAVALRRFEVRLDPVAGVDHHRNAGVLVADEVRGAPQVVVHELPEEHVATLAPDAAISLEVTTGSCDDVADDQPVEDGNVSRGPVRLAPAHRRAAEGALGDP